MHDVTHVVQPFRLATAPDQPVGLAAGTLDDALALPLVVLVIWGAVLTFAASRLFRWSD